KREPLGPLFKSKKNNTQFSLLQNSLLSVLLEVKMGLWTSCHCGASVSKSKLHFTLPTSQPERSWTKDLFSLNRFCMLTTLPTSNSDMSWIKDQFTPAIMVSILSILLISQWMMEGLLNPLSMDMFQVLITLLMYYALRYPL